MIERLLTEAGITINGSEPWDITIHNSKFFARVEKYGTLGVGESYVDGWWDCPQLDQFVYKIYRSNIEEKIKKKQTLVTTVVAIPSI